MTIPRVTKDLLILEPSVSLSLQQLGSARSLSRTKKHGDFHRHLPLGGSFAESKIEVSYLPARSTKFILLTISDGRFFSRIACGNNYNQ